MKAGIISIGDELLIGQVVNSNAAFIAGKLNEVGIMAERILTVGDDERDILKSFRECFQLFDVIVVTGGLGPTHDDITRKVVCKFFDTDLASNDDARKNIEEFLRARNRGWSEAAENQTLIPRGAAVIPNRHGTAPGELFDQGGKTFIVMPGVPEEMEAMMTGYVVPFFQRKSTGSVILHRTLNTTGIPESTLAERLGDIEVMLRGEKLAFLPSITGVRLRITVRGNDAERCRKKLAEIERDIRARAERYIYGVDDRPFEEVLGTLLAERQLTIAVAESCTGGLIAHRLTNTPGSSRYFERAVVTYSDRSKIELLHVPAELIMAHGAVSKEVAESMAQGVRSLSSTNIGLSTTGIAGPTGGSPEKPVGLVWIGYSDATLTDSFKLHLGSYRLRIKERAAQAALEHVRRKILDIDP